MFEERVRKIHQATDRGMVAVTALESKLEAANFSLLVVVQLVAHPLYDELAYTRGHFGRKPRVSLKRVGWSGYKPVAECNLDEKWVAFDGLPRLVAAINATIDARVAESTAMLDMAEQAVANVFVLESDTVEEVHPS